MSTFDIARLTPRERLELISELWDSLTAKDVQLTPAQERELNRRIATFDDDIETATPWESIEGDFVRQTR